MNTREIIATEIVRRGNACQGCGRPYDDPKSFNWHHRDPAIRQFAISAAPFYRVVGLEEELAKCDLLCISCHRRKHPAKGTKTTTISVRLGPKLREQLQKEADDRELTLGGFIRYAVAEYLKHRQ